MALFVSDYGLFYTGFVIAAFPMNPYSHCAEHGDSEEVSYLLHVVLNIESHVVQFPLVFPSRLLRDHALETLTALMQADDTKFHAEEDEN